VKLAIYLACFFRRGSGRRGSTGWTTRPCG